MTQRDCAAPGGYGSSLQAAPFLATSRLVIVGYGLDRDALTTAFRATLA